MDAASPPPPDSSARPAEPLSPGALAAALVEAESSDEFDRRLAAHACSPAGPGFVQARVLRWDARIEAFHVSCNVGGPVGLKVLMHVIAPEWIGPHAVTAWTTGEPAHGEATSASGVVSWFGAAPFGRGQRALIVGRWAEPREDAGERLRAWWEWMRLADIARDRHRAAARAERRVAAIRELTGMIVAPHHVSEVLHAAARLAATGVEADGAGVWLASGEAAPRLELSFGPDTMRERAARALSGSAERAVRDGTTLFGVQDAAAAGPAAEEIQDAFVAPLGTGSPAAGALAVWREVRSTDTELPALEEARSFLAAIADTVAAALERGHDLASRREAEQRTREAERESSRLARHADYGPLGARARADARAAVAAVRTFAVRIQGSLSEPELAQDYAEALMREAERLERALVAQDACTEEDSGDRALVSINELVNDALRGLGERLVQRRVRLLKRLSSDVPSLVLDPRRVGQAITQLLAVAMDSISVGGRVRVETRRLPGHVVLHVAHDGAHLPGEALEQLFVPFVSGPPGGPPVALGVADRIVHEHGGELRVRAEGEWSTVVDLALPIRDLQDRRKPREDRRARTDRRHTVWSARDSVGR